LKVNVTETSECGERRGPRGVAHRVLHPQDGVGWSLGERLVVAFRYVAVSKLVRKRDRGEHTIVPSIDRGVPARYI